MGKFKLSKEDRKRIRLEAEKRVSFDKKKGKWRYDRFKKNGFQCKHCSYVPECKQFFNRCPFPEEPPPTKGKFIGPVLEEV